MDRAGNRSALLDYHGKPSFSQAFSLVMQHVMAAIVGCVTPTTIVSGAAGLDPTDKVFLIQAAPVVVGLAALLQLFPVGSKNGPHIGAALPVTMDASFAYVPSMQAIAGYESGLGVPMISGVQVVGGIVAIIVGSSIRKVRRLFLPLIAGTVVFIIGLSLYPTAANYMIGGADESLTSETGELGSDSWQNWTTALVTLAIVTVLNHYTRGILKLASAPIGVITGYVVALGFGLVDFSGTASAGFFQFPTPLYLGVIFDPSSCVAIDLLFAIDSIQAAGDFSAAITDSMDRTPGDKELQGSIVGYGTSNVIGAMLDGLPIAVYSQNVGIVVTIKAISRTVLGVTAVILLVTGLIPELSAVLTTTPQCALGGVTTTVFVSIAIAGVKLVMTKDMNYRSVSIVGLSVALGTGVTQVANSLAAFPDWATTIFGKSPVVVAICVAILLNVVLPRKNAMAKKN